MRKIAIVLLSIVCIIIVGCTDNKNVEGNPTNKSIETKINEMMNKYNGKVYKDESDLVLSLKKVDEVDYEFRYYRMTSEGYEHEVVNLFRVKGNAYDGEITFSDRSTTTTMTMAENPMNSCAIGYHITEDNPECFGNEEEKAFFTKAMNSYKNFLSNTGLTQDELFDYLKDQYLKEVKGTK